jgi:GTP cyclohydrolase I
MSSSSGADKTLPDIHSEEPEVPLTISHAGIKNYHFKIILCSEDGCRDQLVELSIGVRLPGTNRGVHMSRFIEAVEEVSRKKYYSLYELLYELGQRSLEKHEYTDRVHVSIRTSFLVENNDIVEVEVGGDIGRKGVEHEYLSITFRGVTACPCLQRVYSYIEKTPVENTPTHLQRAILRIRIERRGEIGIDPLEIYRVCRKAFSGLLASKLKRYDEYTHVKNIISNPMFTEDVVRKAAFLLYKEFAEKLDGDTGLVVEAISEESIHVFNTYAVLEASIKDLGVILGSTST